MAPKQSSTGSKGRPRPRPKGARRKPAPGKGPESKALRAARRSAEKTLRDPRKTAALAAKAKDKARTNSERLEEAIDELEALIRLTQAYAKGEYRDVPWTTIVAAVGAVVYFVVPTDLIPDPLFPAGYVDDVLVILFVLASIQRDIDAFERWEEKKNARRSASRRRTTTKREAGSGTRAKKSPGSRKSSTSSSK